MPGPTARLLPRRHCHPRLGWTVRLGGTCLVVVVVVVVEVARLIPFVRPPLLLVPEVVVQPYQ